VAGRQSGNQVKAFYINFVNVATGRWAISLPSVTTALPFCFFFALEREGSLDTGSLGTHLMIVSAGQLTSVLYIFIAQAVLLSSRNERKQNLFICIFVWFSAGLVAGIVSDLYAYYVLNGESYLLNRVTSSLFTTGLALGLVAYWFGTLHKVRVERDALEALENLLAVDTSKLNEDQLNARTSAIETLKGTLLPRVLQLQNLTSGLQQYGSSESLTAALRELDLQAQELLNSLKSNLSLLGNSSSILNATARDKFSTVKLMSGPFPRELSVGTSFILLSLGALIGQSSRNGLLGSFVGILSSLLISTLLFLLISLGKRVNLLRTGWFNFASFLAVYIVQYLFALSTQAALENPYAPWYSSLKVICGVYLASMISTLLREQRTSLAKLGSDGAIRRAQIARMSTSNENIKELTTSTVFGVIQGQISGVIMALNVLTDNRGLATSKRDLSKFIEDTNLLLGQAIQEIQQVGLKVHSR
jgi:hypothetical protein